MTPKGKAKELVDKFENVDSFDIDYGSSSYFDKKQCALIAVDLLIECTPSMNIYQPNFQSKNPRVKEYWQEVKQEIQKL